MERKFILPAATFIGGIIIWLVFFFFIEQAKSILLMELIFGVLTGGLLIISAYSCKRANGPRSGNFIRSGVLIVTGILTFWKIGIASTVVLLATGIFVLMLALNTKQLNSTAN